RPNFWARTVNATSSKTAKRTLISAVVSCSRTSTWPSCMDRAAPVTARPVTATRPANAPSTTTFEPVLPPEEEKNSDSKTIAPKSAMLAAATSLGLVVPVLKDAGQVKRGGGQRDRQQQWLRHP